MRRYPSVRRRCAVEEEAMEVARGVLLADEVGITCLHRHNVSQIGEGGGYI